MFLLLVGLFVFVFFKQSVRMKTGEWFGGIFQIKNCLNPQDSEPGLLWQWLRVRYEFSSMLGTPEQEQVGVRRTFVLDKLRLRCQ